MKKLFISLFISISVMFVCGVGFGYEFVKRDGSKVNLEVIGVDKDRSGTITNVLFTNPKATQNNSRPLKTSIKNLDTKSQNKIKQWDSIRFNYFYLNKKLLEIEEPITFVTVSSRSDIIKVFNEGGILISSYNYLHKKEKLYVIYGLDENKFGQGGRLTTIEYYQVGHIETSAGKLPAIVPIPYVKIGITFEDFVNGKHLELGKE